MANTFFDRFSSLCRAHGESPNGVAKKLGASSGSVTAWKQGAAPRNSTLSKIAAYFDVTTDYLLGASSAPTHNPDVSKNDIKFALFGGELDITDEMYQEVLRFAKFLKEERKKKE